MPAKADKMSPSAVMTCALNGEVLTGPQEYFASSGQFLPKSDPLFKYCGQPICWPCYTDWAERPRFARAYIDAWIKANAKNPFWWSVFLDDDVYISVNPQRAIEEASLRLFAVGTDIRIKLPDWPKWLAAPRSFQHLSDCEWSALEPVLPRLRERFPDDYALVDAIDSNEK